MTDSLVNSQLFWLAATVGIFCLGSALFRHTRIMLLHPVLITFLSIIMLLKCFGIEYGIYREATSVLDFALGMSVVSLGYLMHEQAEHIKGRIVPIVTSTLIGSVVGIASILLAALALGSEHDIITSVAPKSVTVPIAVAIVEPLGGIVAVTSVIVFCTGVFGSICGAWVLKRCGVSDPMARGFALGSAAHGVGTARAIELGAIEGAMSGIAMALMGLGTAMLLPLAERFLY